jgi:hypothetical protein
MAAGVVGLRFNPEDQAKFGPIPRAWAGSVLTATKVAFCGKPLFLRLAVGIATNLLNFGVDVSKA